MQVNIYIAVINYKWKEVAMSTIRQIQKFSDALPPTDVELVYNYEIRKIPQLRSIYRHTEALE